MNIPFVHNALPLESGEYVVRIQTPFRRPAFMNQVVRWDASRHRWMYNLIQDNFNLEVVGWIGPLGE